jgi:hypothetical protein
MEILTLRHIRALAAKRGFSVRQEGTVLQIVHTRCAQIQSCFDLSDPFRLDPAAARQFTLTRAYYWLRGYDLSYADNRKVLMRRGRSHPAFDPGVSCERLFDYTRLLLLQHEIAVWYSSVETAPVSLWKEAANQLSEAEKQRS